MGCVLNRPTGTRLALTDKARSTVPVMFGGEHRIKDEPRFMWLFASKRLKDAGIGEGMGIGGGLVWKADPKKAVAAIEKGLAKADDFLVVAGVSVWTKGEKGSVRGIQVRAAAAAQWQRSSSANYIHLFACFHTLDSSCGCRWC